MHFYRANIVFLLNVVLNSVVVFYSNHQLTVFLQSQMDQMFNFFIQPGNVKVQDEYNNELFSLLLYDNKKKNPCI